MRTVSSFFFYLPPPPRPLPFSRLISRPLRYESSWGSEISHNDIGPPIFFVHMVVLVYGDSTTGCKEDSSPGCASTSSYFVSWETVKLESAHGLRTFLIPGEAVFTFISTHMSPFLETLNIKRQNSLDTPLRTRNLSPWASPRQC